VPLIHYAENFIFSPQQFWHPLETIPHLNRLTKELTAKITNRDWL
jgi:hypothetical protein